MRKYLVAGMLAILCSFSANARAATINLTLVGAGSNVLGPAYIGPYHATTGGNPIDIICDDFISDSYLNESWTASVSTLANVSGTKFHDLTKYEEAAYLASNLVNPTTTCTINPTNCKGDIQYAIWQLFDSTGLHTPFSYLSGNNLANAQAWLSQAQSLASTFTPGMFSNFVIYTPTSTPPTCSGGPCPTSPPQEFVTFVPEPGTLELLGLGLCGAVIFRRPRRSAATIS